MQETPSSPRNQRLGGGLEERFQVSTPTTRYQYIDVQFPVADVDVAIQHQLAPANPNAVNYQVVQLSLAAHIYHDATPTRRTWTADTIYLRSNVADATVRLLLTLPSDVDVTDIVTQQYR